MEAPFSTASPYSTKYSLAQMLTFKTSRSLTSGKFIIL